MKIENLLQRFSCISFLFKPPWYYCKNLDRALNLKRTRVVSCLYSHRDSKVKERKKQHIRSKICLQNFKDG